MFPEVRRTLVKTDMGLNIHVYIDETGEEYPEGVTEDNLGAWELPGDKRGLGMTALLVGPEAAGLEHAYGSFPRPGTHIIAEIDGAVDDSPELTIYYRGYADADCRTVLNLPEPPLEVIERGETL